MAQRTNVDGIANLITHELDKWSDEKAQAIEEYTKEMARSGMQQLKSVDMSGVSGGRSWLKNYSKNWKVAKKSGKNFASYVIHNGDSKHRTYRLTHLLENGHALRYGGRTRAFKHIQPVADQVRTAYIKGVEEILEGKR